MISKHVACCILLGQAYFETKFTRFKRFIRDSDQTIIQRMNGKLKVNGQGKKDIQGISYAILPKSRF